MSQCKQHPRLGPAPLPALVPDCRVKLRELLAEYAARDLLDMPEAVRWAARLAEIEQQVVA